MSKPRVLVLYYSQTGQLREILDSTLREVAGDLELIYALIEPLKPWPFPWTAASFFDAMPESVVQEPAPVRPLDKKIVDADYDLVIFGWQPWFLHPSQPITAFMQSSDARVLAGKPVVTVIGSRNMWLNAGEKIKEGLRKTGAHHIGNIVLTDTNTNLISLLTVIRWSFTGRKEASRWLPRAGVQDRDIQAASRFGLAILEAAKAIAAKRKAPAALAASADQELTENGSVFYMNPENAHHIFPQSLPEVSGLHAKLLDLGAIRLDTGLVLLEQRGIKNFRFWGPYIRQKGGPGAPARKARVTMFKRLLLLGIFVLSPLSSLTAGLQRRLHQKRLRRDVEYFRSLDFEPGRI